jgi:hypothetical protein
MAAYTTIDNPELYFQTKIYTGDGNDDRDIVFDVTDTTMQPNMLMSARRDSGDNQSIYDSVRGDGKELRTAETGADYDRSDNIQALNSNGFQVGTDGQVNASGGTYVSWAWKESADAGFDIVGYTGNGSNRTISHSLSAVPKMMIHKSRDNASYMWGVYHHTLGNQKNLNLNTDSAANVDSGGVYYNSTTPTSSVFSLGTNVGYNASSDDYIAYLWSEKQGYSKCGSYVGTGNADGPFCFTGFRPAFVMIKNGTAAGNWEIFDTKRSTYNLMHATLYADTTGAEYTGTGNQIDVLSNGFKCRTNDTNTNDSADTHVYMAFAEAPFVNSNGVPCNAR